MGVIARGQITLHIAEKGDKGDIGEMIAGGKMLHRDPEFRTTSNSVQRYNNASGGGVTVTRIARPADCPTTSEYCIEIKTSGTSSPGCGGFVQALQSRSNAVFIQKFVAKIPQGYNVATASNSMGSGYSDIFLTAMDGTGKYETYIRKIVCGAAGSFNSGGHVYLTGATPVTWYLASCTAYDMTDTEKYDQAVKEAQQAAEAYALAKANLAEVTSKAYADGVADAAEQAAITAAEAKANAALLAAKAYSDLEVTQAELNAINTAKTYANEAQRLAEVTAKAYADGVVDAEEQRAIADATAKAERAKNEAILAAAMDTTDKINGIEIGAENIASLSNMHNIHNRTPKSVDCKIWATTIYTADWVADNFKPNATYTVSGKIEMLESSTLPVYSTRVGLAFYNNSDVRWIFVSSEHLDIGSVVNFSEIITAPSDLANWQIIGYSSRFTDGFAVELGIIRLSYFSIREGNKAMLWEPSCEDAKGDGDNIVFGVETDMILDHSGGWLYKALTKRLVPGKCYVLSGEFRCDYSTAGFICLNNWGSYSSTAIRLSVNVPFIATDDMATKDTFCIGNQTGNGIVYAKKIKLEQGYYATSHSLSPEDIANKIKAQAVEDSAKNLGLTKIEGGLIWTNLVKLQRIGGQETAGISGIDKNSQGQTLPAFWAGGTYSQALNRQANVDIYHNGKSKLGRLFVNEDGSTVYKDGSNVDRIYITPEKISALSDLTGSSQSETGVNTSSYGKTIFYAQHIEDILLGSIYVSKNSSDLMIKNVVISTSIQNNVEIGNASAEVTLYLKSGGSVVAWIDSVGVVYHGKYESPMNPTDSKTINTTLKVSAGTYQLYAEVRLSTTSDQIDAGCYVSTGRLTWQYIANISKSELGQNGLLSFRDINNYIYAAIENNLLNFVVKTKGKWDTPGVLAAYSVNSTGTIMNRWGGMINTSANAYRASTGTYDIPHQIGHTDYIVTATVVYNGGTCIALVAQKNNNSVRVVIRDLGNNLTNLNFDVVIVGRNVV